MIPVQSVFVLQIGHQLSRFHRAQLRRFVMDRPVIPYDPVDTPQGAGTGRLMQISFYRIVPQIVGQEAGVLKNTSVHVDNVERSIRCIVDVDRSEPLVGGGQKLRSEERRGGKEGRSRR